MRKNCMPGIGKCPRCAGELLVTGRSGTHIGSLSASDILEWRCPNCNYSDKETRHLADGVDGDWPPSKYAITDGTIP
jgi:hypothetical protein